jgi:penicillin amidase
MVKFLVSLVGLVILVYVGNVSIPVGDSHLPPLGKFFSPAKGFWKNGNSKKDLLSHLPNLIKEADVFIDKRGVPHVFAASYIDAARIQGYFHAKDRLFQMDASSRFTAGRLSELFGSRMLKLDKIMRRRGLSYAAESALKGWEKNPEFMKIINAYVEGVNAYIDNLNYADFPVEYKLLHISSIEAWSPLKSACIGKGLAYDLCFKNEDDIATKSMELLGPELYDFLFPLRNKKEDPIIPPGTQWKNTEPHEIGQFMKDDVHYPNKQLNHIQMDLPFDGIGSNNWAVSGSKTKSGAPILCNDPHLRLRLPSVWYEIQLHTPEANVYGVSLPGVPSVLIGFNEYMAWGSTNVSIDVLDWYNIQWANEKEGKYTIDGEVLSTTLRMEEIHVKDSTTVKDTVLYTQWGPLTYQDDTTHYLHNHALRWLGHTAVEADELQSFVLLNQAKTLEDYLNAVKLFRSPAQNLAFASKSGDIALRVSGAIPIKGKTNGIFLQDGSTSGSDWKGFVPVDKNPFILNPVRGFVSSANQISTDSTYPYPYYGYFDDYRGRILNQKLSQMSNITPQDMMRLQNNDESLLAVEGLESMLIALGDSAALSNSAIEKLNQLKKWDKTFKSNRLAPAIFMSWFLNFCDMTWDEFNKAGTKLRIPKYWRTIELAVEYPNHAFFDIKGSPKLETAEDIAILSLEKASAHIDSFIAADADFNWGKYNGNRITHLMQLPAFSSEVNHVNGVRYGLNAVSSTHGPSWRMVVELTDPVQAWGVYPGGQSGHPGSPHYDDMIDEWVVGEYFELNLFSTLSETSGFQGRMTKFSKSQ